MAFSAVLLLICLIVIGSSLSAVINQELRDLAALKPWGCPAARCGERT